MNCEDEYAKSQISPWLLLRGLHVDVSASSAAAAVMASGGEKKRGSFGVIGTSTSFGVSESSSRGHSGVGSTSRQQENPQIAASSGDKTGHDNAQQRPRGGRGGGRAGRNAMESIDALGRCMVADCEMLSGQSGDYDSPIDLELRPSKQAVAADEKSRTASRREEQNGRAGRFGPEEQNGQLYIRANQGHSIKTVEPEQLLTLVTSPSQIPVCVHGTCEKFTYGQYLARGGNTHDTQPCSFCYWIAERRWRHQWDASYCPGSHLLGRGEGHGRVQCADGMKLYISANNVVLTEGPVSAKYFKVVRKFPHKEVLLTPPSQQPSQPPSQ